VTESAENEREEFQWRKHGVSRRRFSPAVSWFLGEQESADTALQTAEKLIFIANPAMAGALEPA
jgi:hypothetical protein